MSSCVVQNCRSISIPNSEIRFHRFPQNEGRKKLWLSILPIKGKLYSSAKICSLHFKPSDYNPDRPGHLLTTAVPFYYSIQPCDCGSKVSNTDFSESLVVPKWGSKENLVSNTGPSESLVVPTNRKSNENSLLTSMLSSEKALPSPYYQVQLPGCSIFDKNVSNTGPSESLVVPTREPKQKSLLMSLLSSEKAPPAPYHIQLPGIFDKNVNLDTNDESPLSAKRRQRDFNVQVKIKTRREVDLEKCRKVLNQKIHRQQKKINDMQSLISIVREYTSNTETENILQGNFTNICKAFNKNQNRKRFVHSNELKTNLDATNMEICRICLVTDVKMYSLEDESIKTCFESITTLNGKSNIEGLPQHICYECKAILFKSYNLIKKSIISQTTLEDIFAESGQITKHLVEKQNRQHLKLVSPLSFQYVPSQLFEYTYDEDLCISNLSNIDNKDHNTHDNNDETTYIDKDEFGENQEPNAVYLNIDTDVIEKQVDDDYSCDETVESENDDIKASFFEDHNYTEPTSETEFMVDSETQSSDIHLKEHSKKSNMKYAKMDMISDTDMQKFFNIVEMSEQKEEYEKAVAKQSERAVDVEYKCDICHKIFFTLAACQSHIIYHDLKRGAFECPVCKIRFKTDKMLSSHTRDVHQRKFHCKSCPKTLNNAGAARNHLRWHRGRRAACALCPYRTAHAYKLTAHVRRAHAAHMHACTQCGHAFVSERGLKTHTTTAHRDADEKSDNLDKVYRCDECDINFKSEGAKRVHILTSQIHIKKENSQSVPDRRLETTCLRCGEEFPSALLKRAHVRREHRRGRIMRDGEAGYPKLCDYCELVLHTRWEHWTHIRRRHPTNMSSYRPVINVVCHTCGKGFDHASKLRLHSLRHSRPTVPCPRCSRLFHDKFAVARHVRTHDAAAVKQHRCATCGRAYFNKSHLRRHAKVHSDEAL